MSDDQSSLHSVSLQEPRTLEPVTQAADLHHPELRALYEFWHMKAQGHLAPARKNIDVLELKRWLPNIQLVDVIGNCIDIRYRVIGTWIVERFGADDTGKTIMEIGETDHSREVRKEFLTPAKTMKPHRIVRPFYDINGAKEFSSAERLMLPLSANGHTCDKVISGLYYLDTKVG